MVDLQAQYQKLKTEIDANIQTVLNSSAYINGPLVKQFCADLAAKVETKHCIPCANGTDALQLALMALELNAGDEIITTPFTFVATAEVIALLKLKPVFVDIRLDTFNIDESKIEAAITAKTKCILPVHLFGQAAQMDKIDAIAKKHNLFVIEDNAQSINASFKNKKLGNWSNISTTSFYPAKNLGAYGDAGAVFTNDDALAEKLNCFANHGQTQRYFYGKVGINSRLDSLQAAVLLAKLQHLDEMCINRFKAAVEYSKQLQHIEELEIPFVAEENIHVFHQYTLQVKNGKRDALKAHLAKHEIPSRIYYPKPLHLHDAYKNYGYALGDFPNAETASEKVLSLPMHPDLTQQQLDYICKTIKNFYK